MKPFSEWFGIPVYAKYSHIKKAYRKLAKKYHPDSGGNIDMMKKVNHCMNTLNAYRDEKYGVGSILARAKDSIDSVKSTVLKFVENSCKDFARGYYMYDRD
eukprot:456070-Amorphochlora_amoeboformis.AAC.1